MNNARARLLWTMGAVAVITAGTFLAIRFAQGYRPSRDTLVAGRGLVATNSLPTGARVFVNGTFTAATNDTLYLEPGDYTVRMEKDGYFPWEKRIAVEKEIVSQANARLFPLAPSLAPLSYTGALNVIPSPDGQRVLYATASSSAQTKPGYYVVDLSDSPLSGLRSPRQIAELSPLFPPESTEIVWSPNSAQVLLHSGKQSVLLDPSRLNDIETAMAATPELDTLFPEWEEEMYLRDRLRLQKFPDFIQYVATASAVNVYFSPDEKRVLFTAAVDFVTPDNLLPAKAGSNGQPQDRAARTGTIYVYDREEDRQFRLGSDPQAIAALQQLIISPSSSPAPRRKTPPTPTPTPLPQPKHLLSTDGWRSAPLTLAASPSAFLKLKGATDSETLQNFRTYHTPLYSHGWQWFPSSTHLITHDATGIRITEYDGTNTTQVYSGPFNPKFVYPWPNGNKLVILTNFTPGTGAPDNLYSIDLR